MRIRQRTAVLCILGLGLLAAIPLAIPQDGPAAVAERLLGVVMGPSPIEEDLRVLTDEIGGRMTGSEANRRGVRWAVDAFRRAGVDTVATEAFTMPTRWAEGDTRLEVLAPVPFGVRVVSLGWSPPTPDGGIEAAVVDVGDGDQAAFATAGAAARGNLLLVHSPVLHTWMDLFEEYFRAGPIIARAQEAGAAGILWTSSREHDLLYRHQNAFDGQPDVIPQALVAREDALRISRFLAAGQAVRARLTMPNQVGGPFDAENVLAEILGDEKPEEVVMIGAHLDSWELGSGALDNGANCALVVEVARAVRAAGIRPRRTLRFALWNGEEQGLFGSWAYARDHREELDDLVAYVNFDSGTGPVTGYSLGGRGDIEAAVREVLAPLDSWGMGAHTLDASTGTDHIDFLLEGVPTLLANQEEANYMVNYHASSDTFDKVDLFALKRHAAYAAVTVVGIANREDRPGPRQSREAIEGLLEETGLDAEMKAFGMWEDWEAGRRGRRP
jgi:hypothetical protein